MTLVMKKFTTRLSRKPKPNRKPRFFLQNLPKPTDRKHFETVTTLAKTRRQENTVMTTGCSAIAAVIGFMRLVLRNVHRWDRVYNAETVSSQCLIANYTFLLSSALTAELHWSRDDWR